MSEPVATPRYVSNSPMQERLRGFRSSRKSKMFGIAEVVALAGSCLILLLVLLSYLYFLVPARSRLASLQADRAFENILERFRLGDILAATADNHSELAFVVNLLAVPWEDNRLGRPHQTVAKFREEDRNAGLRKV